MGNHEKIRQTVGIFICAVASVFTSCDGEGPGSGKTPVPSSDMNSVTATIEDLSTKIASQDGLGFMWENKDVIAFLSQDAPCLYTTTLAVPKKQAVFKANKGLGDSGVSATLPTKLGRKYLAVYPSTLAYEHVPDEGSIMVNLNSEQVAGDGNFDRSCMMLIAASEGNELTFKHVAAYIRFGVSSAKASYNRMTVTLCDESQCLVSRIKVDFEDDELQSDGSFGVSDSKGSKSVSFRSEDGSNFSQGTYLVAINPGSYEEGLLLTFENEKGDKHTVEYPGPYNLAPGDVIEIGDVGSIVFPYVYEKNGRQLGVVFYQDPDDSGKRKVLSHSGILTNWASSNDNWRVSSYKEDYDYVHTVVTTSEKYMDNPDDFPAVRFCDRMRRDYGGNWHVPSLDEMNKLFNGYYGKPTNAEVSNGLEYSGAYSQASALKFDSLLKSVGGEAMLEKGNAYWICGQNSNGNMQYVSMGTYFNGNGVQTEEKYVRCVLDVDDSKPEGYIEYPGTDIGKHLKGPLSSRVVDVMWDTTHVVTHGLDYYQMRIKTDADEKLDLYLLRANLSEGLDIKATISSETTAAEWHLQNLREMAAHISTASNPVYAIVNSDFSDKRTPLRPRGPVHCDGTVWCSTFSLDPDYEQQGLSYIGMTYDGKMVIGPRDEYDAASPTLRECSGAGLILIQDSKVVGRGSGSRDPRTAIGYTSGDHVWILAVDGRHKGTEGMTYTEMSSIFFGLGCKAAVNMDGGGSTQMLTRDPLTGILMMRNWPSDPTNGEGGQERPRLNGWAIVKK